MCSSVNVSFFHIQYQYSLSTQRGTISAWGRNNWMKGGEKEDQPARGYWLDFFLTKWQRMNNLILPPHSWCAVTTGKFSAVLHTFAKVLHKPVTSHQTNHTPPLPHYLCHLSNSQNKACADMKDARREGQARRELARDWFHALDGCSFSISTFRAVPPLFTNSGTGAFLSCTLWLLERPSSSLCILLSFRFSCCLTSLTFFPSPLPTLGATRLYQSAQW